MNELIKVNCESGKPTMSARELWEFLDKPWGEFLKWFNQFKDYGFAEYEDYRVIECLSENPQGGRPATDYEITLDMAKELAMLQKSEKGQVARRYFIELEKKWNSPEAVMARAVRMADQTISRLNARYEEALPLITFAETCTTSKDCVKVRELAKMASKNGVNIGQNRLFVKLREWKHLMENNEPYQEYIDRGYYELAQFPIDTKDGVIIRKTTRVTPKGQIYIIDRLRKEVG